MTPPASTENSEEWKDYAEGTNGYWKGYIDTRSTVRQVPKSLVKQIEQRTIERECGSKQSTVAFLKSLLSIKRNGNNWKNAINSHIKCLKQSDEVKKVTFKTKINYNWDDIDLLEDDLLRIIHVWRRYEGTRALDNTGEETKEYTTGEMTNLNKRIMSYLLNPDVFDYDSIEDQSCEVQK